MGMAKMRLQIAALCLVVQGCAPMVWDKAGATEQDFKRDSYGCERDVRQSGYYGQGLGAQLEMQAFYKRCMEANGWTARSGAEPRASSSGANAKTALHGCGDEAERVANTRNSFDPIYKETFERCASR
jgi:hypothetical protein